MSARWIRRRPGARDWAAATVAAATAAAAVGTVVFYLTRMVLSRDPLGLPDPGTGTGLEPSDRREE